MNRIIDQTSEALLAAAHRLLAEAGADALTVRQIAHAAGMSTMNVYSRFGGKDGVIDELYVDGYRRLFAEVDAVPDTDDVQGDLLRVGITYRKWAIENPQYYAIMFRSALQGFVPSADSVDVALDGLASLVGRVARGQRLGAIVAADGCDPTEIAAWLWGSCHGMISLELDQMGVERVSWESVFVNGLRTAINGLHPSVARAPSGH